MLQHSVSGTDLPTAQFDDQILQSKYKSLVLQPLANAPVKPPTKRRKMEKGSQTLPRVMSAIYRLLGREFAGDCSDLGDAIKYARQSIDTTYTNTDRNNFNSLGDPNQCQLLLLLGYVCCATDGTLIIQSTASEQTPQFYCAYCSAEPETREVPKCIDSDAKSAVLDSFKALVDTSSFNELRRPRVEAMVVLRRLVRHSNDSAFLDLEFSSAGIWCMRSLHSSFRELRIAARYGIRQ
jgi:serine/threonine-protein kinase ATR